MKARARVPALGHGADGLEVQHEQHRGGAAAAAVRPHRGELVRRRRWPRATNRRSPAWTALSCGARGPRAGRPGTCLPCGARVRPRRPDRHICTARHRRDGELSPHPPDVRLRRALRPRPGAFPIAERIGDCTVSLPLYPHMPLEHVDIVARAVQGCLDRSRQRRKSRAQRA